MNHNEIFSQDYRHFDNLIWQVPVWATALSMFSMYASNAILQNECAVENYMGISGKTALGIFYIIVFVILLLLSRVLHRFRSHQAGLPPPKTNIKRPKIFKGQFCLQLIIAIEYSFFLMLSRNAKRFV